MILSILIPTTKARKPQLDQLLATLLPQMKDDNPIEVLIDSASISMAAKLKGLIKDSVGEYIWVLKDSNLVSDTAIQDVLDCARSKPCFMQIKGMTVVNGANPYDWEETRITIDTPIKKEIAVKALSNDINKWLDRMNNMILEAAEIKKPIIQKRVELKRHTETSN